MIIHTEPDTRSLPLKVRLWFAKMLTPRQLWLAKRILPNGYGVYVWGRNERILTIENGNLMWESSRTGSWAG